MKWEIRKDEGGRGAKLQSGKVKSFSITPAQFMQISLRDWCAAAHRPFGGKLTGQMGRLARLILTKGGINNCYKGGIGTNYTF